MVFLCPCFSHWFEEGEALLGKGDVTYFCAPTKSFATEDLKFYYFFSVECLINKNVLSFLLLFSVMLFSYLLDVLNV